MPIKTKTAVIKLSVKIIGKSLANIASYPSRPIPGQEKICSKMTEPPIRPGMVKPNIVIKGSKALRFQGKRIDSIL